MRDKEDQVPSRCSTGESYGQPSSDVIQIFLQTQKQESQVFTCSQSLTIAQLKARLNQDFLVEPKAGTSDCSGAAARFSMSFKGKELCKEWQTLRCAGVQANETLTIRVPLVGGSYVKGFFGDCDTPIVRTKFYDPKNQEVVKGEKREKLQTLLSKTSFVKGMRKGIQEKFESIFEIAQIEEIMKIDVDKGYEIKTFDKKNVYIALNLLCPKEKMDILSKLEEQQLARDHKNFVKMYIKKSVKVTQMSQIVVKSGDFSTIEPLQSQQPNTQQDKESLTEKSKVIWSNSHVFSNGADDQIFVDELKKYDLLPKLTQGSRLYPIVSCLDLSQMLEILSWDVANLPYVSDFLTALTRTGKMVGDWALLKKMWPKLSIDERFIELQLINEINDIHNPVIQNNYANALIKREMEKMENSKPLSDGLKIGINNIWDCLEPKQRQASQVVCSILDQSDEVNQQVNLLLNLNMDNRVDFLSYLDPKIREDLLTVIDKRTSRTGHEGQIFRSELLHHQYFHLKEGLEEKQIKQKQGSRLEELDINLKKVQEDMKKTWKYIPFDMPGDYLQSIPVPESNDEFICIQPNSRKDLKLQSNEVIGRVNNINAWSSEETKTNEKERKKNENMRKLTVDAIGTDKQIMILENQFSIISFWKYSGKDHRTFDCQSSFATPTIIPFQEGSCKKHKRQYLFEGRNKQIFFFQTETDVNNPEKKQLQLCLIKKRMEEQQLIRDVNRKTDENILQTILIPENSKLYNLMMPRTDQEESHTQDQKFHHTAPTLIDCGSQAGKFIVFSLFQLDESGPSLYFHSIELNKVVSIVKGGEVFIDFVTGEDDESRADGSLYFMTDTYFYKTKWGPLNKNKYRSLMKIQQNTQQILKIDFSLKDPVLYPIDQVTLDEEKKSNKVTNRLQLPPKHTEYPTDDVNMKFSRASYNIISIQPIKRENLLVHHIAIIAFNFISRRYSVLILDLSLESHQCKLLTSFENPNMSSAFIQHCQEQIVIQTVIKGEEDLQLQFSVLNQKTEKDSKEMQYQLEPSQRMSIPAGRRFYAQPMIFTDKNEIFGCFLDKNDYAVNWYHEKLSNNKLGKYYQTETIMPEYIIDYPLMCFDGPFPDSRELTIVNLADMSATRSILQLQNMKLIRFVSHRLRSDKTKVCFLAIDRSQYEDKNNQQIVHVILCADKMFQKKLDFDMSYFSVEVGPLGVASENHRFRKYLPDIVKMESVHNLNFNMNGKGQRSQCFVIQYQFGVYLYTHHQKQAEWFEVSRKGHMKPIRMKRGYNNTFYYVESDALNYSDSVIELKINEEHDTFKHNKRVAFELVSGTVIALEIDPDNDEKNDSGKMSNGSLGQRHISNELFLIDDSLVLMELKQPQPSSQSQLYQSTERKNLVDIPRLAQVLRKLMTKPFPNISLTGKCIVYDGMTFNLDSSLEWTQNFDFLIQKNGQEQWQWKVNYASNIDSTHRQLLVTSRTFQHEDMVEFAFVTKPLPSSRKVCLVGMKGMSAVEFYKFISNELILLKFSGNYWCMIDTIGQIREIPHTLLMLLNQATFKKMTAQRIYEKGKILILLESEFLTLTILFDHNGSVCETHEYEVDLQSIPKKPQDIITFDRVFADDDGKVYRILDVEVEGQSSIENKEVPVRFQQVKQEVKSQVKDESSLNLIIFYHTKKEKSSSRQFLICGKYLCWHNPEEVNCDEKSSIEGTEPSQKKIEKIDDKLPHHSDIYVKPLEELIKNENNNHDVQINQEANRISMKPYLRDKETRNMSISVPPISTHLSQRSQQELNQSIRESINKDLLQVTIEDRAIIYDLSDRKIQAIKDFSNMQQLIGHDNFVDSEVNIQNCYSDDSRSGSKVLRITRGAVSNHSKEFFFAGKSYRTEDQKQEGAIDKKNPYILPSSFDGLYKTYCESNYEELMRIHENLENREHVASFDISAILSTYKGQSVFSMQEQIDLYSLIEKKLRETEFQSEFDKKEVEIQSNQLRRLFQVLMTPQNKLIDKKADEIQSKNDAGDKDELIKNRQKEIGMFSCLEMIPYSKNTETCSKLIAIANLCEQSSIIDYADSQHDTNLLLRQDSDCVEIILQETFTESETTKLITNIKWPKGQDFAAFQYHSCLISQKQCEEQIKIRAERKQSFLDYLRNLVNNKNNWHTHSVKVRVIDIAWLYADKKAFLDFIDVLINVNDNKLLMTDFVKAMLDVFWDEQKMKIMWRIFFFYFLYLVFTLLYMINVVCGTEEDRHGWKVWCGIVNIVLSCYMFFYVELISAANFIQSQRKSGSSTGDAILKYVTPMNLVDLTTPIFNVILVVCTIVEIDYPSIDTRRVMCSILVLFIWGKMFYWFQMFDRTSFYIRLIGNTVYEIINFFIIFIIFLFTFGSAMYVLSTNREGTENDPYIISDHLENWIGDVIINQYLLSLGEFDGDMPFAGKQTRMVWIFFFLATFFTQVLALNMLIAIMSNTFDRVNDSKELYERLSKIYVLFDYVGHFRETKDWEQLILRFKEEKPNKKNFIFIVTPFDSQTQQESEWEGGINMIRKSMKAQEDSITTEFNQTIDSVKSLILDQKARSTQEDKQTRKIISEVQRNQIQMKENQIFMKETLNQLLKQGQLSNKVINQVIRTHGIKKN